MRALSRFLHLGQEEDDPAFRSEIERLSVNGLRIIAGISIGANLIGYAVFLAWVPMVPRSVLAGDLLGFALLLGAVGLTFWDRARPYLRTTGLVFLFFAAVGQIGSVNDTSFAGVEPVHFIPVMQAIVLMLGMACLPLRPNQTLALGAAITAVAHWLLYGRVRVVDLTLSDAFPVLIMLMLTLVGAAATAVVYAQRAAAFTARRRAQESLEALETAQSRLLVSETATSQNRLAAALCHELNTPLGTLSSSLGTLLGAHDQSRKEPQRAAELDRVFSEAARAGRESLTRLRETLDRMKRVTNLDRAEELHLDINALLEDTVALLRGELTSPVKLDLEPLPPVRGRAQPLTAVLSNLIRNASAASDHDKAVVACSRVVDGEVLIEIRDRGRGIPEQELARLFEPAFRADNGRITTTNWSMFVARGIVTEHGGHIEVDSEEGKGTTARVCLPAVD